LRAPRTREADTPRDERNATGHIRIQPLARGLFLNPHRKTGTLFVFSTFSSETEES